MKNPKPVVRPPSIVEGIDGRVVVNIFTPGHKSKEIRLTIPNIVGAANLLHRSPENIEQAILNGLRAKYGERVG